MAINFTGPQNSASTATTAATITRYRQGEFTVADDILATEEPLEIRLAYQFLGKPAEKSVSVTMRTPGEDRELAMGFLFGESVVSKISDVEGFESVDETQNILRVHLRPNVKVDMGALQRNFYTTSSCGVCGKASLQALELNDARPLDSGDFSIGAETVIALPDRLRASQTHFEKTGGIHAAGLFDASGNLLAIREDVGRHNALDKLIGARLLADDGAIAQKNAVVVLSGRASFELLQKALMAHISIVVAVGAPSSLAVRLAEEFGITLLGFTRKNRFNIYAHDHRIDLETP